MTLGEYIEAKLGFELVGEVSCPGCGAQLPGFALTKSGTKWRCGHCHIDDAREVAEPFVLGWPDVRALRNQLLTRCDWTQALDIPEGTRTLWAPVRAELRDIPQSHHTPEEAMSALGLIEATHFAT